MNLSEHFTLEEATFSSNAVRMGINNDPPASMYPALKLAAAGMEQVRALLGHPVHVDSWFRCPELNSRTPGSATHSAHMDGYAVDFTCPPFGSPKDIVRKIAASDIKFDKVIMEGTWVHISFAPALRRLTLIADFSKLDKDGKPTYTQGVA
jgi:hypothetical protein